MTVWPQVGQLTETALFWTEPNDVVPDTISPSLPSPGEAVPAQPFVDTQAIAGADSSEAVFRRNPVQSSGDIYARWRMVG